MQKKKIDENKIWKIFLNLIPVLFMIILIPIIENDYLLAAIYIVVITVSFFIKYEEDDNFFFIFGFIAMIIAEFIFVSTKVEVFYRNSLFGIIPFWLPFLWAYAFVVMKRGINILKK